MSSDAQQYLDALTAALRGVAEGTVAPPPPTPGAARVEIAPAPRSYSLSDLSAVAQIDRIARTGRSGSRLASAGPLATLAAALLALAGTVHTHLWPSASTAVSAQQVAAAVWQYEHRTLSVPPAPTPTPTPTPVPPPTPPPAPAGYSGPLWGVLVVPDNPTPEQSALRTSAAVRAACAAAKADWTTHLAGDAEVSIPAYAGLLAKAGTLPAVVWLGEGGKVLAASPAAAEADVLAQLKQIRGGAK